MLRALDLSLFLLVLVGAFLIHGSLLFLCWLARFLYRPDQGEWLALLFTASQKTLPIALGLLALMQRSVGAAMVACIVFHFLQLLMDSMKSPQKRSILWQTGEHAGLSARDIRRKFSYETLSARCGAAAGRYDSEKT